MATKIAVNQNNAMHIMSDNGLTMDMINEGINTIPQPSEYYFYVSDIMKYIKKCLKK